MRVLLLIVILVGVAQATAQEQSPADRYGRPTPSEDIQSQEPANLWGKFQDALSKFVPPQQPGERPLEQPLDAAASPDSPAAQRQALWDAATKLTSDVEDDPNTSASPTATPNSPHAKDKCLDPSKFQPGQVGYLDYYLFKVVDFAPSEVYLAGEHGKEPFCLTGVDTEDLQETQVVVIPGNVRVRGTKLYKSDKGDKLTVRVVKLLTPKESEIADAERALQETEHPLRTWTSKDGKHKIEARFSKFAGGKVHLINKAGKAVSIAPNNLSAVDRDYYRDLVKKARDAARKSAAEDDTVDDQEPFAGEERLR